MKIKNINQNLIKKIFRQIRQIIKVYYHKYSAYNPLGTEFNDNGKSLIEINESKVIDNEESYIWMFGLINRVDKQSRIYWVMNYCIRSR